MQKLGLLAVVATLLASPAALAQSANSGLDLPVTPPRFGDPIERGWAPENDDGQDPRDTPPPIFYGEEIDSESDTIIYVLDISCSMGWDNQSYQTLDGSTASGPRLDRAKVELTRSVFGLAENFRFNIVVYNCSTQAWSRQLEVADDSHKQAALAWIAALRESDGTGTGPATALALFEKENQSIVLLTDGAPNCGAQGTEGHRSMIRAANTQGAVVNVFGISASGEYRAFCQGVAADSGGSYFDIP